MRRVGEIDAEGWSVAYGAASETLAYDLLLSGLIPDLFEARVRERRKDDPPDPPDPATHYIEIRRLHGR